MNSDRLTVRLDRLRALSERLVEAAGFAPDEARQIVDVMLYAELRGNNQGLTKIAAGAVAPIDGASEVTTLIEKGAVLHLDGGQQNGMIVIADAARQAVERAKNHGIACVAVRNSSGSTGAIGYYVRRMAEAGVVGILMGGTPKNVAPAGSIDGILGTNPMAVGFPNPSGAPVVLDLATSAIAYFGLIGARDRGEAIPGDVAMDADGKPTTDPAAAIGGAIRAFAGHKGSGLALMVELLTGALVGGGITGAPDANANRGTLIVALDPAALGTDDVAGGTNATLAAIKGARPEGDGDILLPGERGDRLMAQQLDAGEIEIDRQLLDALEAKADEAGISVN